MNKDDREVCEFCGDSKNLIERDFNIVPWWYKEGYTISKDDYYENSYGVFIDRGYLRLADLDDCNCVESGEKIKINYCPICGKPIKIKGDK